MPPYKTTPNLELSLRRRTKSPNATAPPRKKACQQCTRAKSRCDLDQPVCTRCRDRRLDCVFVSGPRSIPRARATRDSPQSPLLQHTSLAPTSELIDHESISGPSSSTDATFHLPDDVLGTQANDDGHPTQQTPVRRAKAVLGGIAMRWIAAALPDAQPRAKFFSRRAIHFCCCYLRTVPLKLLTPLDPPSFVHSTQLGPGAGSSLSHTTTLVQMWDHRAHGSEELVLNTITTEMKAIAAQRDLEDASTALAAFQSYLILTLLVYFHVKPVDRRQATTQESPITFESLLHLQFLADQAVALSPLTCAIEQGHSLAFDRYVHAEALRRTVYAFCVFDDIFNSIMGLPTYVAHQLGGLPAPGPRRLWTAGENAWDEEWRGHEQRWSSTALAGLGEEPGLRLKEFWAGEEVSHEAASRLDRWLAEADAFGVWVFGVSEMSSGDGAIQPS